MLSRWAVVFAAASVLAAAPSPGPVVRIRVADWARAGANGATLIQDPEAPVSFELPAGWELASGTRWGDHETTLTFTETQTGLWANAYYQYPSGNLDAVLRFGMDNKVKQRREREGLKDYTIRQSSIQQAVVAGWPALSWIADYTDKDLMKEYLLRYIGSNDKAEVFTDVPATIDLNAFIERIQPIIQSLRIP